MKLGLNWQKVDPAKIQIGAVALKKRQEILDDWNVKILPSKKKQIQIQRRNTNSRTFFEEKRSFAINSKGVLGSFVTVARKQQKPEKVYENVFS